MKLALLEIIIATLCPSPKVKILSAELYVFPCSPTETVTALSEASASPSLFKTIDWEVMASARGVGCQVVPFFREKTLF